MLESIRKHAKGWLAYIIVALICIPFALWGIGDYLGFTSAPIVASVNGEDILQHEFIQIHHRIQSQEPFTQQMDQENENRLKQQILEELITERVQLQGAHEMGFRIADTFIHQMIASESEFQKNGKFSQASFEQWLRNRDFTEQNFVKQIKESFLQQNLQRLFQSTAFATKGEAEHMYLLLNQTRDVMYATLSKERFQDKLNMTEEALRAYYDQNPDSFKTEESVQVEYLEFSTKDLPPISVQEAELKKYFEENTSLYAEQEKRKIAHILLTAPGGKTTESTNQKISEIKKRLNKGEAFGKLALEFSEDVATKQKEGVLGWFSREELPLELAQGAFQIQSIGTISEPVQTNFGVHLIKLLDKQTPKRPSFESVASTLKTQLEQEKRNSLFAEKRAKLADLTYENPDSLNKAATELSLPIQESGFLTRKQAPDLFSNPKIKAVAFSDEVLRQGLNSEVIEITPEHVMVLRNKEYKPSELQPFESVKNKIAEFLTLQQKSKFAEELTTQVVQELNANAIVNQRLDENQIETISKKHQLGWKKLPKVGRRDTTLPNSVRTLIFELPHPDNKILFRSVQMESGDQAIVAVIHQDTPSLNNFSGKEQESYQRHLEMFWGQADYALFVQDLKSKAKIKKKVENL